MAASGAKVLHLRCVEYARRFDMPIHVRSSFSYREGTWVVSDRSDRIDERDDVEQPIISGVAHDRSEAKVTVVGVPDQPGEAARDLRDRGRRRGQHRHDRAERVGRQTGRTDITFTLPKTEGDRAMAALAARQDEIGFESLQYDAGIGKVSLVGAGMRSHPGVSATFFRALADAGVNVELISTSEIRISVVCRESDVNSAVNAVHSAFGLDAESGEAVVYGGTGR